MCRNTTPVKYLFPTSLSIILFCSPLFHLPSSLHCSLPPLLSTFFPSLSSFLSLPPDQGEAICSGNPSLILAQRSWKMYSRQTVGRCRLALGPQQVPGSALMEHYFHPFHPTIPPFHILYVSSLPPFGFSFMILSYSETKYVLILFLSIYISIYLNYFWKWSSRPQILMKQKP